MLLTSSHDQKNTSDHRLHGQSCTVNPAYNANRGYTVYGYTSLTGSTGVIWGPGGVGLNPSSGVFDNGGHSNRGSIIGGTGGTGIFGDGGITGGAGGVSASLSGGALNNSGTIVGDNGGLGVISGIGGVGVYVKGGTLTNAGTISGGTGSSGQADAVKFGSVASTLIVDPGAVHRSGGGERRRQRHARTRRRTIRR